MTISLDAISKAFNSLFRGNSTGIRKKYVFVKNHYFWAFSPSLCMWNTLLALLIKQKQKKKPTNKEKVGIFKLDYGLNRVVNPHPQK